MHSVKTSKMCRRDRCKPALIPQQVSQSKAVAKEALDNNATVVSEGTVDTAKQSERSLLKGDNKTDGVGKKQAKKIKKQLKKQSKQCKKLKKLIKQQKKLQTKHLKLKSKIYQLDNQLTAASIIVEPIMEAPQVH